MSFKDCVSSLVRQGQLTAEEGQRLRRQYDSYRDMPPGDIKNRMIAWMQAQEAEKERVAGLTLVAKNNIIARIESHRNARGLAAPAEAAWMLVESFGEMKGQDIENLRLAILGRGAQAKLEELLYEFRKGAISGELRRNRPEQVARLDNIVRELFGENTGDARAKELAAAWTEVADQLRKRFNQAGGAIRKLEKWGLPQVHDQLRIIEAGKEAWKNYITPLLDREKTRHALTGAKMTESELSDALDHIYETIATDGWNARDPSLQSEGMSALYKQHSDHRFLHFKDADSWMQYQREFGEADAYASMMGHISMMSRDIAAMEILGPNPELMLNFIKGYVTKKDPGAPATVKALHKLETMWAHYKGSANMPVSNMGANIVATIRNLISSASLGMASISSLGDIGTSAVSRKFIGLPAAKAISGYFSQMGADAPRHAVRSGLILESAIHTMHQHARYIGSISGKTWSGYLNDRVLTYNGMQPMTRMGKHAFGMDFQAMVADLSKLSWDQLESGHSLGGAMRRTMERHGITADDWELMRGVDHYVPDRNNGTVQPPGPEGTGILRPSEVAEGVRQKLAAQGVDEATARARAEKLADLYLSMILRETRYAIPESTIAGRAAMVGTNQPGTFIGELVRSGGQFKSFPVSFATMHGGRIMNEIAGGHWARGAAYAGGLLIVSTLLGAAAMQLKAIAKGDDPRSMEPIDAKGAKFWGAAMLQGGGLGIFGDFLFAEVTRTGSGLSATVAGPMVERIDNLRKLTIGNFMQLSTDEKTNFGRELSKAMRQNAPGGNLPFTYIIWNRLVMDQLQYLMDADAHGAFRRQRQQKQKDYSQQSWWRPGDTSPDRGPDLSRMWP